MTGMPTYSIDITVDPSSTVTEELWVEGEAVDWVSIRFPPGPSGLLEVAIFYGEKQIWPSEEGQVFKGDNEWIHFEDYWPLPETPCRLIIKAVNRDEVYEHSVYVRLHTKPLKAERKVKFRVTPEGFIEVSV